MKTFNMKRNFCGNSAFNIQHGTTIDPGPRGRDGAIGAS